MSSTSHSPHTTLARAFRRAAVVALIALGGVVPTQPLSAQAPSSPHFAVAAWTTEQGLPSSIVLAVQQTPDGYLWLGSYEGIVRFDGVSFRTYSSGDIPGLERGSFPALVTDRDGALWAGSESGELVRFANGKWRVYSTGDGLPPDRITMLLAGRDGTLWIGTRVGLWRFANGRITPVPPPSGVAASSVVALAEGPDGALWIGTIADGVLRYANGAYTRLTTREGLISDRIDALHADADGTLWVGAYGSTGVARVRDGVVTPIAQGGADAPRRVRFIRRDRGGRLWLAAENGLFVLREGATGTTAERIALETGGTTKAETLFEDRQGNLWLGTRQSGLFRLREASFSMLSSAEGLPNPFVFAVDGDGASGAWIATQDGALHRPSLASPAGQTLVTTQTLAAMKEHVVRDVLRDPSGDVWLATTGGLTRVPAGNTAAAVTYTAKDGLADDRTRTLAAGRDGVLWVGTFNGVSEWRAGALRSYGPADGLTDGYILSVHEDRRGTLWVGTQTAGLFRRLPGGRFAVWPAALARQPIFRITEDADGTLWVGTARGLARVRPDGSVAIIGARQGLPGNTIFQALDDGRGFFWLTGPWGITRVSRSALGAVADGRAAMATTVPFGRGDGMEAREASSLSRAWRAPDGRLWFPTPAGIAVIDPARLPRQTNAPAALVEGVVADGRVFERGAAGDDPIALPIGTRTLELRYTAPTFLTPQQLRFRYRLDGYDADWVEGDTRRAAYYTNLAPGRYRFRVQARAADGPWTESPMPNAEVAVWLRPHVWQTRWFATLVVLSLGAGAIAAYRLRMRAVARSAAWASREEVLRAMSLRDELTGLYNRRGLLTLAEQAARTADRERRGFTLLFADLDGLKGINDTFGHAVGDRAIADAATILRATFRDADVVARLGGDEFAVLLPVTDEAAAAAACARLETALARHVATSDRPYRLSLSLGASVYDPAEPRALDELLDDADRRMYDAKRSRRTPLGVESIRSSNR